MRRTDTSKQPHTNNPTQHCAVTQQPQRDAVQQRTRYNTKPQSQYCGTAPYSLRSRPRWQCTPKTRILHRTYDAAAILHISASQAHITHMPTSAGAPRYHPPQTRAHRRTRCGKPRPAQRHGSVIPRAARNSARQQATHGISHTLTQHTNTQALHARTTSRTAATTVQCAIITTRAPRHACTHTARHTDPRTPHTAHRKSHTVTRGLHATLTPELPGCPASTACCRRVGCCPSLTPCRTHDQPSRHTMAPSAAADPSQQPAHIPAHRIATIKSSQMTSQLAHCMLSLTHNTVCE